MTVEEPLAELARRHGIALEYWDQQGHHHAIERETVVAVLAGIGVSADTDAEVAGAIEAHELADWHRVLPPVFVHRQSRVGQIWVHLPPQAEPVRAHIVFEDGSGAVPAVEAGGAAEPRVVAGTPVGETRFEIPAGLPLGWHQFQVHTTGAPVQQCPLVVTPDALPLPRPGWGLMAQLYSLRSSASWGIGDLADLRELAVWSGRDLGADWTLVNPLHASAPVTPLEPSPYLPATRAFVNPLYLRIEDVSEYAELPVDLVAQIEALATPVRALARTGDPLDRDRVWTAKLRALELLWAHGMTEQRAAAFQTYCVTEGVGLQDFALWCALSEVHGPRWQEWPEQLRDPRSQAVTEAFAVLEERVTFYAWLQWLVAQQLADAQESARAAGMGIGIIHDLAVGVHGDGADAWRLGPVLAADVSVGAPPDLYNALGQDWSQPPWRPQALAEQAFAPYRDLLRSILRHAGGIRVDHVLGLYRQWWIPAGMRPDQGTYVAMEHEALVGILALEAARVGAVVVGEDLGTVEDWIRADLADRGILGTGVLWFERLAGGIHPPEQWRAAALASVTVHDLPPSHGYLLGEHVRIRAELGLLAQAEADRAEHVREIADWTAYLQQRGWCGPEPSGTDVLVALHRCLAASPALLLGVSVPDLTGDITPQNQPGTHREYPNWTMPLRDAAGHAVLLEDLMTDPDARTIAAAVRRTPSTEERSPDT